MLRHIFADGGHAGPRLREALKQIGRWTVRIVKRPDSAEGVEVPPRRWVVERTPAWLGRCRLSKDWEKSIASAERAVFAFRGRRGDRVKLLFWDGQGFCLYYKVLEHGRFPWPTATEGWHD